MRGCAVFDPEEVLSIKDEPELRHALAHMYYAIEALAKGHRIEALYELKSIEALIFWEDDDHMTKLLERGNAEKAQDMQVEEELQGEVL